jgi:hypothetical protein
LGVLSGVRLWRWVRGVIAETGEHEPVPIWLEREPGADGYALRLGYRAGFGGQVVARIPIRRRSNPHPHPVLKEIHSCEIAGRTLEAANVHALRAKVARALETIAPARTLPLCYFRVPAMDYALPVYERRDELTCAGVGAPNLKGRDLAEIRRNVCRYLQTAGYVRDLGDVEVGVLRPSDLSLVVPAAIVRSLDDEDVWMPAIEGSGPDGPVVGVLAHAGELRASARRGARPSAASPPAAEDVLGLVRSLRVELSRARRTTQPPALYAAEVRPELWAAGERRLAATGACLVGHLVDEEGTRLELPIRRTGAGDLATALEDDGITAFLARDEDQLASDVGRYLAAHGFLRFPDEIELAAVAGPRAERLEADDIWTHGDDFAVHELEETP